MRASTESLEGNRVKLSIEVEEAEIDKAVERTYRRMAGQVRIPGFRPGKVPRRILEARLGAGTLRLEAIQDALPDLYAEAIRDADVDAIASPEIDITDGKESGPVTFDAVVEVRPTVSIAGYEGLQVTMTRPSVSDEDVEAQLVRMREQGSHLETVDRPAADGDMVTISVSATRDGKALPGMTVDDVEYRIGSDDLVAGLDAAIVGVEKGATATFDTTAPDGEQASLSVSVSEVKERVLPEATDAWAADVSEFETLEELREALRQRLIEVSRINTRAQFQERVVEALVALVADDPPQVLVDEEVRDRLEQLAHRLERQGVSMDQYMRATGTEGGELVAQATEGAADAVKADLALRALASERGISISEDEMDEELARIGEQVGQSAGQVRLQLERSDRLTAIRSEMRKRKALEWLVENVSVVDEQGKPLDRSELGLSDEAQQRSGESEDMGGTTGEGAP
ncbi:MAG: trigger factor [Actinomycetota bacterium]|nr:trigger factor [Actinomycetota bacterium]